MKPNFRTLLITTVSIGVVAVYGLDNSAPRLRQPHPPTSSPPVKSKPGPKPAAPPSIAKKPSAMIQETPIQKETPVSNGRQGYIVFAAAALFLLRKPETS